MEAGESPDDGDECFLGGVLPVGVVARKAPADGVDLGLVAPQQLLEGTPVSGLCSLGESGVVEIVANLRILCSALRSASRCSGQEAGTW